MVHALCLLAALNATKTYKMALSKAIQFINALTMSEELRSACSHFSKNQLMQKLDFNEFEFEDAINAELVQCKTFEQAAVFQEIKIWFLLI